MPLSQSHQSYRRYNNIQSKKLQKKRKLWPFLALALLLVIGYNFFLSPKKAAKEAKDIVSNIEEIVTPKKVTKPKPKDATEVISKIEAYLESQNGTYGYAVYDLKTDGYFGMRDTESYTAASSIKVAFATYVYNQIENGKMNPNTAITYLGQDFETGTGSLQGTRLGTKYKISYLLERMIHVSDNIASNMLVRYSGRSNIQKFFDNKGYNGINIYKNQVTPKVMNQLLVDIYNGRILNSTSKDELTGYMVNSLDSDRIVAGVPEGTKVAHKIGTQVAALSDIGIVYKDDQPYVITVYSKSVIGEVKPKAVIAQITKYCDSLFPAS
jgi:beta-lactamase class A